MDNFLSKKSLQPIYAVAILLLLLCAVPIFSGPGEFGVDMYSVLKGWGSGVMGFYIWISILVPIVFILLAIPSVSQKLDSRTDLLVRLIGSGVLLFFMIIALLSIKHFAWGWGLWIIVILTVLLFINVMLGYRNSTPKAELSWCY
ncbi:MAG: hypothetical protein LBG19_05490 [Prevotellaceae bacterium]|nr:hypothetical protein [Prevotellaceae bacterium]